MFPWLPCKTPDQDRAAIPAGSIINLLDSKLLAIDGSRFKAVNAKARNYTRGKMRQKLSEIDTAIERYIGELDRADEVFEQTGGVIPEA